jgi:hypothetical protein
VIPNQFESLKQQHDRNEAEIARGEREYRRSIEAIYEGGDGFAPAHDGEYCECGECLEAHQ